MPVEVTSAGTLAPALVERWIIASGLPAPVIVVIVHAVSAPTLQPFGLATPSMTTDSGPLVSVIGTTRSGHAAPERLAKNVSPVTDTDAAGHTFSGLCI